MPEIDQLTGTRFKLKEAAKKGQTHIAIGQGKMIRSVDSSPHSFHCNSPFHCCLSCCADWTEFYHGQPSKVYIFTFRGTSLFYISTICWSITPPNVKALYKDLVEKLPFRLSLWLLWRCLLSPCKSVVLHYIYLMINLINAEAKRQLRQR